MDASLELSSLCVLDAAGKVIREAKVASEPEALVAFLRGPGVTIVRVGLEAGALSQWLCDGLQEAGFEAVLLGTRHVKAALCAMAIKTDRRDARGIAQLRRMGWYRPVHRKSVPSQEVRALLAARIRELVSGHAMLERIAEPMLTAREALWDEFAKLHREVHRADVDDPARFAKSKSVGAFFGLTPKRYQSGETDVTGAITKIRDAGVRTALHDAANALLTRATRFSTLRRWGLDVAKRRGMRRAKVALGRKLAAVLHRIRADGTEFVWGKDPAAAAAA